MFLIISFVGGCAYLNKKFLLKDDHFLEEITEGYIEQELGIDLDLTPETKE